MKKIKHYHFYMLAFAAFGLFHSCSSDDSEASVSDTYIRFTINGKDYNFKDIITTESLSIAFNGNNGEVISNVGDAQISLFFATEHCFRRF